MKTEGGRQNGFTLIELVVVMAIIASLTGLATFNFNQARTRARDVQRKSETRQIQNALELYKNDRDPQRYPTNGEGLAALVTGGYMTELPIDPREKATDGSWADYSYNNLTALTYTLTACLENTADPDKTAGVCGPAGVGVNYQQVQP